MMHIFICIIPIYFGSVSLTDAVLWLGGLSRNNVPSWITGEEWKPVNTLEDQSNNCIGMMILETITRWETVECEPEINYLDLAHHICEKTLR